MSIIDDTSYIPVSFAKMLFNVPVVDPQKPEDITERPIENIQTVTPTLPVIGAEGTDVEVIYSTVNPLMDVETAEKIAEQVDAKIAELTAEDESIVADYEITYQDDQMIVVTIFTSYDEEDAEVTSTELVFDVQTGESSVAREIEE